MLNLTLEELGHKAEEWNGSWTIADFEDVNREISFSKDGEIKFLIDANSRRLKEVVKSASRLIQNVITNLSRVMT